MMRVTWATTLFAVGWAAASLATAQPKIELSETLFDFGTVWQGEPLSKDFTIKNVGDGPLTLEVESSCGCTTPTMPKSPLGPGESDKLTITYRSDHRKGPANQRVTIKTNDPSNPAPTITVRGDVKPMYSAEPDRVNFGRVYPDSTGSVTIEIKNLYTEPMPLKLKEGQDLGIYDAKLEEKEPGQKYTLTVALKAPLAIGAAMGNIELLTGQQRLPEIAIPLNASVRPPILVEPGQIFWPKITVTAMERTLRVVHAPGMDLKLLDARASDPSVEVALREVPADKRKPDQAAQEVVVKLPPGDKAPDLEQVVVEIKTDAKEAQYQRLEVPIKIIGPRSAAGQ